MVVLVTGGAGFIGSRVVEVLATTGHEVRVIDALLPTSRTPAARGEDYRWTSPPAGEKNRRSQSSAAELDAEFVHADLRDPAAVDMALRGVDAVCHQAAMVGLGLGMDDAPDYVSCNDLGTAVLLAGMARAGIDCLVLASSMVVYGEGGYVCADHGAVRPGPRQVADLDAGRFDPPCPRCGAPLAATSVIEDAAPDPRNVYAATKVAQEHLAASWARLTGGRAIALRYHNVYGPGMPRDTPYAGVAAIFHSAWRPVRHRGSSKTGDSGGTSSTSTTSPAPISPHSGPSSTATDRSLDSCAPITSAVDIRTPWRRWRRLWRAHTGGRHRSSPAITASATYATSPRPRSESVANSDGMPVWRSLTGWPSSRAPCAGFRRPYGALCPIGAGRLSSGGSSR